MVRTGGSIALATLISRITGFVRTVLLVGTLGGAVSSAFQAAYVLPNMIAEVVLGAVLTAIVIPVLVRAEAEDPDRGEGFVNRIHTHAGHPEHCNNRRIDRRTRSDLMNVGSDSQVNRPLTTALAYLLLPEILFYGLSALFMAILNVKNVFRPGAWAPVLNNVVQIATLVLYYLMPGELTVNPVKMTNPQLLVLGIGTTLGVVVQAVILLPYLRRAGVRLRLQWGIDARLRRFGNMAAAIVVYVLVLQVGLIVTYHIAAAHAESGIIAYATHGSCFSCPTASWGHDPHGADAAPVAQRRRQRQPRRARRPVPGDTTDDGGTGPVVVYMTFFGRAIGPTVFDIGEFGPKSAAQLGSVLAWGAFTLIPYAMTLVQLRVFYAREDAWTRRQWSSVSPL